MGRSNSTDETRESESLHTVRLDCVLCPGTAAEVHILADATVVLFCPKCRCVAELLPALILSGGAALLELEGTSVSRTPPRSSTSGSPVGRDASGGTTSEIGGSGTPQSLRMPPREPRTGSTH
jgi:hypothetical protein